MRRKRENETKGRKITERERELIEGKNRDREIDKVRQAG